MCHVSFYYFIITFLSVRMGPHLYIVPVILNPFLNSVWEPAACVAAEAWVRKNS